MSPKAGDTVTQRHRAAPAGGTKGSPSPNRALETPGGFVMCWKVPGTFWRGSPRWGHIVTPQKLPAVCCCTPRLCHLWGSVGAAILHSWRNSEPPALRNSVTWIQEFRVTWIQEFKVAWIQEFKVT